jgi:hypothetical protein
MMREYKVSQGNYPITFLEELRKSTASQEWLCQAYLQEEPYEYEAKVITTTFRYSSYDYTKIKLFSL